MAYVIRSGGAKCLLLLWNIVVLHVGIGGHRQATTLLACAVTNCKNLGISYTEPAYRQTNVNPTLKLQEQDMIKLFR